MSHPGLRTTGEHITHVYASICYSLGATHDGSKENADCPGGHNYMMSPSSTMDLSTRRNAYFFSKCSVRQMKATLR